MTIKVCVHCVQCYSCLGQPCTPMAPGYPTNVTCDPKLYDACAITSITSGGNSSTFKSHCCQVTVRFFRQCPRKALQLTIDCSDAGLLIQVSRYQESGMNCGGHILDLFILCKLQNGIHLYIAQVLVRHQLKYYSRFVLTDDGGICRHFKVHIVQYII